MEKLSERAKRLLQEGNLPDAYAARKAAYQIQDHLEKFNDDKHVGSWVWSDGWSNNQVQEVRWLRVRVFDNPALVPHLKDPEVQAILADLPAGSWYYYTLSRYHGGVAVKPTTRENFGDGDPDRQRGMKHNSIRIWYKATNRTDPRWIYLQKLSAKIQKLDYHDPSEFEMWKELHKHWRDVRNGFVQPS